MQQDNLILANGTVTQYGDGFAKNDGNVYNVLKIGDNVFKNVVIPSDIGLYLKTEEIKQIYLKKLGRAHFMLAVRNEAGTFVSDRYENNPYKSTLSVLLFLYLVALYFFITGMSLIGSMYFIVPLSVILLFYTHPAIRVFSLVSATKRLKAI